MKALLCCKQRCMVYFNQFTGVFLWELGLSWASSWQECPSARLCCLGNSVAESVLPSITENAPLQHFLKSQAILRPMASEDPSMTYGDIPQAEWDDEQIVIRISFKSSHRLRFTLQGSLVLGFRPFLFGIEIPQSLCSPSWNPGGHVPSCNPSGLNFHSLMESVQASQIRVTSKPRPSGTLGFWRHGQWYLGDPMGHPCQSPLNQPRTFRKPF